MRGEISVTMKLQTSNFTASLLTFNLELTSFVQNFKLSLGSPSIVNEKYENTKTKFRRNSWKVL
jgi:hypothetical protein